MLHTYSGEWHKNDLVLLQLQSLWILSNAPQRPKLDAGGKIWIISDVTYWNTGRHHGTLQTIKLMEQKCLSVGSNVNG